MLIGGELGARRSHARDFHSLAFFFPSHLVHTYIYILIRPSVHPPSALRQTFFSNRLNRYGSALGLGRIKFLLFFRGARSSRVFISLSLFLSFKDKEK